MKQDGQELEGVQANVTSSYILEERNMKKGVGVLLSSEVANCLAGYVSISDRVLMVKIRAKPVNLNVIQVYAPTSTQSDEEVEEFYGMIEQAKAHCKNHEVTVIMGDMNAKVGGERQGSVLGPFGLGERNDRGVKWIDWCESQNQSILNTWFQLPPRGLWTWKSPGERYTIKLTTSPLTVDSKDL